MVDEQLHKLSVGSDALSRIATEQKGIVGYFRFANPVAKSPRTLNCIRSLLSVGSGISIIQLVLDDFFHFLKGTRFSAAGEQRKEIDITHGRSTRSNLKLYRNALVQQLGRGILI